MRNRVSANLEESHNQCGAREMTVLSSDSADVGLLSEVCIASAADIRTGAIGELSPIVDD